MQRSHVNIINKEYDGTMIDLIFQKNYDIVISKIKDDTQKIQKTASKFKDIDKSRKEIKSELFGNIASKGTNFIMKEVENVNQNEIVFNSEKDLNELILPDF